MVVLPSFNLLSLDLFQFDFPKVLRVVQKIDLLEELKFSGEKRVEVKKFNIPFEGDITILNNGDIFIEPVDNKSGNNPSICIRQSDGIIDSYDSAFFSIDSSGQSSLIPKIAKILAKAGVAALV